MKKRENHFSKPSPDQDYQNNGFLKYTGLGFQMIATILLGVWLGTTLDNYFEMKTPIFTASLSLFAVVAAIYLGVKDFIK